MPSARASPRARELDGATVAAASLFVDRRESTVNESGDYLFALREGAISGPEHIRAELGELLDRARPRGGTSPEEITLFKSLGLAIEDLASAALLYEKARREGRGQWVEFRCGLSVVSCRLSGSLRPGKDSRTTDNRQPDDKSQRDGTT